MVTIENLIDSILLGNPVAECLEIYLEEGEVTHDITSDRLLHIILDESEKRLDFHKKSWEEKGGINHSHDIHAQHKNTSDIVNHWAEADPTNNKQYTGWVLKQYHNGQFRQEDSDRIHGALEAFKRYQPALKASGQADINKHDWESLNAAIRPYREQEKSGGGLTGVLRKNAEIRAKGEGITTLHNDDKVHVFEVHTPRALKAHGDCVNEPEGRCRTGLCNASWCTMHGAWPTYHGPSNEEKGKGPLYIIHDKTLPDNNPNQKLHLHFETFQLKNKSDRDVEAQRVAKKFPVLNKLFHGRNYNMFTDKKLVDQDVLSGNYGKYSDSFLENAAQNTGNKKVVDLLVNKLFSGDNFKTDDNSIKLATGLAKNPITT